MGRYIVKLTDKASKADFYLEWSTVVDAPVTWGMSIEEFKTYYKETYGASKMDELKQRLDRTENTGTSSLIEDLSDLIECNRAGEKEAKLTYDGIIYNYCTNHITH